MPLPAASRDDVGEAGRAGRRGRRPAAATSDACSRPGAATDSGATIQEGSRRAATLTSTEPSGRAGDQPGEQRAGVDPAEHHAGQRDQPASASGTTAARSRSPSAHPARRRRSPCRAPRPTVGRRHHPRTPSQAAANCGPSAASIDDQPVAARHRRRRRRSPNTPTSTTGTARAARRPRRGRRGHPGRSGRPACRRAASRAAAGQPSRPALAGVAAAGSPRPARPACGPVARRRRSTSMQHAPAGPRGTRPPRSTPPPRTRPRTTRPPRRPGPGARRPGCRAAPRSRGSAGVHVLPDHQLADLGRWSASAPGATRRRPRTRAASRT